MAVYLLHFAEPYEHARHYVGFVDDDRYPTEQAVETRLAHHLKGQASPLLAAVVRAGIEVSVARVWSKASRDFERRLKGHSATRYCPTCRGPVVFERGWWNQPEVAA